MGLEHVTTARYTTDVFFGFLRSLSKRWRTLPLDPRIPRSLLLRYGDVASIAASVSGSNAKTIVDSVISLISHEPATWGGTAQGEGLEWKWNVPEGVRQFASVEDSATYLELVQRLLAPEIHSAFVESQGKVSPADPGETCPPHISSDLWLTVSHLIRAERWDQVVREAGAFFEHYLRGKHGGNLEGFGAKLIAEALHPERGCLGGDDRSEKEGWHLLSRGFTLALRNPVTHGRAEGTTESTAFQVLALLSMIISRTEGEG